MIAHADDAVIATAVIITRQGLRDMTIRGMAFGHMTIRATAFSALRLNCFFSRYFNDFFR